MEKKWYKEMSVYQIWPRSFCDGNGDGIGQFLRFTSGLLHVKACNVKHKITSTLREVSNLYYFICINVIETRPLEDRN